ASALREGALGLCLILTDLTDQHQYEELQRTQAALQERQKRLAADRAAAKLLQEISSALIQEENDDALYTKLLDAAMAIMRSDFASLQIVHPERGVAGELRLLAFRGFDPRAAQLWEWVGTDSKCS